MTFSTTLAHPKEDTYVTELNQQLVLLCVCSKQTANCDGVYHYETYIYEQVQENRTRYLNTVSPDSKNISSNTEDQILIKWREGYC
jgi:hypothetical protein